MALQNNGVTVRIIEQNRSEMFMRKRNRGGLELGLDILRLLDCPRRRYQFVGMARTTYMRVKGLLVDLERRGLVVHEGTLYMRTALGLELLNCLVAHGFPEYRR